MHSILTVTLNPALDIATSVGHVAPGVKLRCAAPTMDPGGGGLNVARAIHQLGGRARAFVALGGDTGRTLERLIRAAGLTPVIYGAPGETRQSLAVTDIGINDQYRFMLPGPAWSPADVAGASDAIAAEATGDGFVVLSGSGPSGAPPDLYAILAARLQAQGARVVIDTSGPPLAFLGRGQPNWPFALRMDQAEAEGLALRALPHRTDTANFAADLVVRKAADIVIIARGAEGSVLVSATQRLHVAAARVPVRSKVGAGDSFVGGFVMALAGGQTLSTALSHGAAAASAAVMTEGTELCTPAGFAQALPDCVVTAV